MTPSTFTDSSGQQWAPYTDAQMARLVGQILYIVASERQPDQPAARYLVTSYRAGKIELNHETFNAIQLLTEGFRRSEVWNDHCGNCTTPLS